MSEPNPEKTTQSGAASGRRVNRPPPPADAVAGTIAARKRTSVSPDSQSANPAISNAGNVPSVRPTSSNSFLAKSGTLIATGKEPLFKVAARWGASLMVGFGLVALVTWGDALLFAKFMNDFLTNIPSALLLLGAGGMFASLLFRSYGIEEGTALMRFADSWFDLVQQFFCIAAGVFVPVRLALFIADEKVGHDIQAI